VEWLERNAGGVSWGILRCELWGKGRASLHAEGRAVDWHLDAARPSDRSACFTEKGKPRKHLDRTTAHRDHIHFGLSWAGARKRTSFWRPDDE
jgi:hypothetical protein